MHALTSPLHVVTAHVLREDDQSTAGSAAKRKRERLPVDHDEDSWDEATVAPVTVTTGHLFCEDT